METSKDYTQAFSFTVNLDEIVVVDGVYWKLHATYIILSSSVAW